MNQPNQPWHDVNGHWQSWLGRQPGTVARAVRLGEMIDGTTEKHVVYYIFNLDRYVY